MNNDFLQNKVYNYFNIGDAKALIKLKEKWSRFFFNKYKSLDFGIRFKNKIRTNI